MKLKETLSYFLYSIFKILKKPQSFRKLGCLRDPHDDRDFIYQLKEFVSLPLSVNLLDTMKWCYDQGNLGSCTGQGSASAFRYSLIKNGQQEMAPSRLFIYYNGRDDKRDDTGACIRNIIKALAKFGTCDEASWPYLIDKFSVNPGSNNYAKAQDHQILRYERVNQDLLSIKSVLASGYPIVCGLSVYESFMTAEVAKTGIIPMPKANENPVGGHCILIGGYKDGKFLGKNSWGPNWGQGGNFELPEEYLTNPNLAHDFWVIYTTEGK